MGTVHVGGSFAYRLMVTKDIDVHVILPAGMPTALARATTAQLLLRSMPSIRRMKIVDFIAHPADANKPKGIWYGLEVDHAGSIWTVDLWLVHSELDLARQKDHLTKREQNKLRALPDERRVAILAAKRLNLKQNSPVSSVAIYRRYLNKNLAVPDGGGSELAA